MISIVTTSTVSTVTTVTIAGALATIGICTLLTLLIQKELTASTEGRSVRFVHALGRVLRVGIVPLLIGFAIIVAFKIAEALQ